MRDSQIVIEFLNKVQNKIGELGNLIAERRQDYALLALSKELIDVVNAITSEDNKWTDLQWETVMSYYTDLAGLDDIPYISVVPYRLFRITQAGSVGTTIGSVYDIPDYLVTTNSLIKNYVNSNRDILKGEQGDAGNDGYTPVKGIDYFDGAKGDTGASGKDGVDGYTPIKGVDYTDGVAGPAGTSATISVGTVSEGTTPAVTNSGTASAAVFNFVLVRGEQGPAGVQGIQGPRGYGLDITYMGLYANMSSHNDSNTDIGDTFMVDEPEHQYHGYAFFYYGGGTWSNPVRVLGDEGWTPIHGLTTVGDAVYLTLTGFVGGVGTPPVDTSVTTYVTTTGYSTSTVNAINIRGLQGIQGTQGIQGKTGSIGPIGPTGNSIWIAFADDANGTNANFVGGPYAAFMQSANQPLISEFTGWIRVKGDKGDKGDTGATGATGTQGTQGLQGDEGLSAYEIAVNNGFVGTESEWITSLKGDAGTNGTNGYTPVKGVDYFDGDDGLSAYEIAVLNGFVGTEQEWLDSLKSGSLIRSEIIVSTSTTITTAMPIKQIAYPILFVLPDDQDAVYTEDYSVVNGSVVINDPLFEVGSEVTVMYVTGDYPVLGVLADGTTYENVVYKDQVTSVNIVDGSKIPTLGLTKQLISEIQTPDNVLTSDDIASTSADKNDLPTVALTESIVDTKITAIPPYTLPSDVLKNANIASNDTEVTKLATVALVKSISAATDFTPIIENQYGVHPGFSTMNSLFQFMLEKITEANNPDPNPNPPFTYNNPDPSSFISGQKVITSPGTYTFNVEHYAIDQPAVLIQTNGVVRLENCNIKSGNNVIQCRYNPTVDLQIINCRGWVNDHISNIGGDVQRRFLSLVDFKNLTLENCYMEGTGGIVIAGGFSGSEANGDGLKIRYNQAKNISGVRKRTDGSHHDGTVQFVQLRGQASTTKSNGVVTSWVAQLVPNVDIAYNIVINQPGLSHVEDVININSFRGTPTSRMKIRYNYIKGAHYRIWNSTNYSGGGIIVESSSFDGSLPSGHQYYKDVASRYVDMHDNYVVMSNNYTFAVAAGNEITVTNNRGVNKGYIDDEDASRLGVSGNGREYKAWANGPYGYDYYGKGCTYNVTFDGNTTGVVIGNSLSMGYQRNDVNPVNRDGVVETNRTYLPDPITRTTEDDSRSLWNTKVSGKRIGVNGNLT
jgi:hypothetical protein